MIKYLSIQSTRNVSLIELLNSVQYKDYRVIAILPRGEDHIAYLELKSKDNFIPAIPTAPLKQEAAPIKKVTKERK